MSLEGDASVYLFENEPINSLEDLYELLDQKFRSFCEDTQPNPLASVATSTSSPSAKATVPSINCVNADSLSNRKGYSEMLRSMPKFKGGPDDNFNAWMLNKKSNFGTCPNLSSKQKCNCICPSCIKEQQVN